MSIPLDKVLLIEDNAELAQLISHMLGRGPVSFFTSVCLTRLAKALERLRLGDISAAVLDLGLPDSSGLESLRTVRSEFPELPVVVLTGLTDEAVALQALREGAQ